MRQRGEGQVVRVKMNRARDQVTVTIVHDCHDAKRRTHMVELTYEMVEHGQLHLELPLSQERDCGCRVVTEWAQVPQVWKHWTALARLAPVGVR